MYQLLLKHKYVTALFIIFIVIYTVQLAVLAPTQATIDRYQLSTSQSRLLSLAVIVPIAAIWAVALVGYLRVRSYSEIIANTKDGKAFACISRAAFWLAIWLPITLIADSETSRLYQEHPAQMTVFILVNSYINLALLAPFFINMYRGSQQLLSLVNVTSTMPGLRVMLAYITFAAMYTGLTFSDAVPWLQAANGGNAPDWLLGLTVIIPRLLLWFLGLLAIHGVFVYRRQVKGVLYRAALESLARGVGVLIVMIIMVRITQSISLQMDGLGLAALFGAVYLLLAGIAAGFVLLARGSRKLQRLEEL